MQDIRRIPLHEPSFDLHDAMSILETLRSTWVSTGGPCVERFERDFAKYVGTSYAVSVCNGTIALQLILECLRHETNIRHDFDVLVPTLTFMATAAAVVHAGGQPVFVDCSKEKLNISVHAVEALIRKNYRKDAKDGVWRDRESSRPLLAVMAAHIMGWTGEAGAIAELCKDLGIAFIEDAAESLGTFHSDGAHAGTQSLASAFSFNGNKILTTGGGGMIATNNKNLAKLAKHLSTTAKTDSLRYEHDMVGHNFRMVNILASLGCSQLEKLPNRIVRKREIFEGYGLHLNRQSEVLLYQEENVQGNNWLVNTVFKSGAMREKALQRLNERDIEARPLWTPLHLQKAFRDHPQYQGQFPNAENFWRRTLSMPSSPGITHADISLICEVIKTSLEEGAHVT